MILIQISAFCKDEQVFLIVSDNGRGFSPLSLSDETKSNHSSIGIQNVRERISRVYKGRGDFLIESVPGEGTRCTIIIPYLNH